MKLFIFEEVEKLTYNYHSGGGLVVIAEDTEAAKALISTDSDITITEEEWSKVKVYELMDNEEPAMFIFPDAGCC
jgi:hypothetical protein